jgi:response regulator of citrate/malate metabolism
MQTLKETLEYIAKLEEENAQLRKEIEFYKSKNSAGRKKHDDTWMTSYKDFVTKYESGLTIMEIVEQGEISRRTAYRYKAYYNEQNSINKKRTAR